MGVSHFVRGISLFAQCGVAAAIIALTITKLSSYTLVIDGDVAVQDGCVMGNSPAFPNMSICTVNYIVAGIGIAATFALSILLCFTCDCCGFGPVLELVFAAAGIVWYAVTGALVEDTQQQLNAASPPAPLQSTRMTVVYLYYVAAALFGISVLAGLWEVLKVVGSCCGCGPKRGRGKDLV